MKAVVTGASSGIGKEIAILLSSRGYETVLVGRNVEALRKLSCELEKPSTVEVCDLSNKDEAYSLFERHRDACVVVNSAGLGVFGEFDRTELDRELEMLNVNIVSLHVLTKLYYSEFVRRGKGSILNVSSSASYFVGPAYSSYYASKAYVTRLTSALACESKKNGYGVTVTLFCPGPVKTAFGKQDGIKDGKGAITPRLAARKAVDGMLEGKALVFPNVSTRILVTLSKIFPERLMSHFVYSQQLKKITEASNALVNDRK